MAGGMKKRRKYLEIAILLTFDSFFFSYHKNLFPPIFLEYNIIL